MGQPIIIHCLVSKSRWHTLSQRWFYLSSSAVTVYYCHTLACFLLTLKLWFVFSMSLLLMRMRTAATMIFCWLVECVKSYFKTSVKPFSAGLLVRLYVVPHIHLVFVSVSVSAARLVWCKPDVWPEVEASTNTGWALRWYFKLEVL